MNAKLLAQLSTLNSTYGMLGMPKAFTAAACGAYIPKRSMVIKNKRRKAHLARTRRH